MHTLSVVFLCVCTCTQSPEDSVGRCPLGALQHLFRLDLTPVQYSPGRLGQQGSHPWRSTCLHSLRTGIASALSQLMLSKDMSSGEETSLCSYLASTLPTELTSQRQFLVELLQLYFFFLLFIFYSYWSVEIYALNIRVIKINIYIHQTAF